MTLIADYDEQRVLGNLARRFTSIPLSVLEREVEGAELRFFNASVRDYLDVLIERDVRRHLES